MSVPVKLGVLGFPLDYTLSPVLHRAGLAALGLAGSSEALRVRVDDLGPVLGRLAADGWRGVNLTHPLKQAALAHLASVSDVARRARSVNTVGFDAGGTRGETTDGAGFLELLAERGWSAARAEALLFGAGGAARSLALALLGAGARVTVLARRPEAAAPDWEGIDATPVGWESPAAAIALERADLVVNATPLAGAAGPCPPGRLRPGTRLVDLVYGPAPTPWVTAARAAGHEAVDGLGLLVHQARRSLSLWTGREVPLEPLAAAVGWPR